MSWRSRGVVSVPISRETAAAACPYAHPEPPGRCLLCYRPPSRIDHEERARLHVREMSPDHPALSQEQWSPQDGH